MSQKPYIIEGCKSSGGVQPRLEISTLQKNLKQFSLFVQALNNIMKLDYKFEGTDAVNWEQLAGIHGMPYKKWSGDVQDTKATGDRWEGYCHHRDPLFPTWHRVVMLLVEQAVWKEAKAIASKITHVSPTVQEEWKVAADHLRFPYWDWTKPVAPGATTYFPEVFRNEKIKILQPDGTSLLSKNPLYSYRFGEIHKTFIDNENRHSYFKSWGRTYRWPEEVKVDPKERYQSLDNAFISGGPSQRQHNVEWLRDKVASLFTYRTDLDKKWGGNAWDHFSNIRYGQSHQSAPPYSGVLSALEEPHDTVHLNVGSNGHMGDNDVAGFDPIFYLHHCNVDRIYAFWEYVYPTYWVGQGWYDPTTNQIQKFKNVLGTYTADVDSLIDQSSVLTPFRKSESLYWSSNDVRGLVPEKGTLKYYTYPAIEYGNTKVQVDKPFDLAKQADYISALQKYWSPDLDFAKRKLPVLHAPIFSNPVESDDPTVRGDDIPDGYETFDKYKLFVVAVTISEHAYQGSFHVELRPRGVPGVVVNKVSFLRRGSPANCAACREREASGSLVRSTMILNSADIASVIHDKGLNREDAGDEEIVQLLKDTFEAKIVAPDGTVLAETQHRSERGSSLKPLESGIPELTFYSASAAHPKDDVNRDIQFCEWKKHTTLCSGDWVDRR